MKIGQLVAYKASTKQNGILDGIRIGVIDEINEFNCFHILGEQSNLYYEESFIVDYDIRTTIFDFIEESDVLDIDKGE